MEKSQIKKACGTMRYHVKIAWRGFCRTVYSAMVAGLIAASIYGFTSVKNESGWMAVIYFAVSFAMLVVASVNVYILGGRKN